MKRLAHNYRSAFTLIEALVVISIAVIALAIIVPVVGSLTRFNRIQAGINTVNVASMAIRTYAMQTHADLDPPVANAKYSGTGILFTPAGEIRLVQDAQTLTGDDSTFLEPTLNGFSDIPDRDYVRLPDGVGVVGIVRDSADNRLLLITPPFGVRFNQFGQIVAACLADASTQDLMLYDGDYNAEVVVTAGNPGLNRNLPFSGGVYDPDPWDPRSSSFVSDDGANSNPGLHPSSMRYKLPFEEIETVVGVMVYSLNDLRSQGLNLTNTNVGGVPNDALNTNATDWILANGRALFFSRYGGHVMQENRP